MTAWELYVKVRVAGEVGETPVLNRRIVPNYAPSTPSTIDPYDVTDESLSLSWNHSYDPEGDDVAFHVWYGRDDILGDGWTYVGSTQLPLITVDGLNPGKPYMIRLVAMDEYGASGAERVFGPYDTYEYSPYNAPSVSNLVTSEDLITIRKPFVISFDLKDQDSLDDIESVTLTLGMGSTCLTLDSKSLSPSDVSSFRVVKVDQERTDDRWKVSLTICVQSEVGDVGDVVLGLLEVVDKEGNEGSLSFDYELRKASLPSNQWTVVSHGKVNEHIDGPGPWPGKWADEGEMSSWFMEQSTPNGWMFEIGHTLYDQSQVQVEIHRVQHDTFELETWNWDTEAYEPSVGLDEASHHVLLYDWSDPSDFLDGFTGLFLNQANWYAYAAGDALYALLNKHGIEEQVSTLIGYSRGGVVASECARRLLRAGINDFQVVYLDAEGWGDGAFLVAGYADHEFHGWSGTRTDQYRQRNGNDLSAANSGGEVLDEGNDRRLEQWPIGYEYSGELKHERWPEYFYKSVYIADDPQVGACIETPHVWFDEDGEHGELEYPTQAPGEPHLGGDGLFNPSFTSNSLAGWCYHGGGGQNIHYESVDDYGEARLLMSRPEIRHNWSRLNSDLHYSFLKFDSRALSSADNSELNVTWNGLMVGDSFDPSSGIKTVPVDFDVAEVGRLQVALHGSAASTEVAVDDIEFITTDKPTIGWLSLEQDPDFPGIAIDRVGPSTHRCGWC